MSARRSPPLHCTLVGSHIQRIVLATEETAVTQQAVAPVVQLVTSKSSDVGA